MIFFTTYVTIIRRNHEGTEKRRGSPARVEGSTIRLPIETDVQAGDQLEHRLPNDEPRRMIVIDAVHPYMNRASTFDDHIELTCVPSQRVASSRVVTPVLHPAMSVALSLVDSGQMSEAVFEALRIVEERVRYLAEDSELDLATMTGQAADDECEGFRLLFTGAMLGLRRPYGVEGTVPTALDETLEYLALASMLMRRLDRAESRLG
ncbi:MAG: hypothetical protein ACRDSH_04555 [Pseudonocardiaceae bacterium]